MARSCFRAHHLYQYAKLAKQPGLKEQARWAAVVANVAPHELGYAKWTAARLVRRGAVNTVGLPFLWFAWRYSVHHGHAYIE